MLRLFGPSRFLQFLCEGSVVPAPKLLDLHSVFRQVRVYPPRDRLTARQVARALGLKGLNSALSLFVSALRFLVCHPISYLVACLRCVPVPPLQEGLRLLPLEAAQVGAYRPKRG